MNRRIPNSLKRLCFQESHLQGSFPRPTSVQDQPKYSLPYILDGEYFEPLTVDDKADRVTARCQTCLKVINGSGRSTGNWRSHINRMHPELIEKINLKSFARRTASANPTELTIPPRRTLSTSTPILKEKPNTLLTNHPIINKSIDTNSAIKNYIINEMLPLNTIDSPNFRNLISTISRGQVNLTSLMYEQKLKEEIDQEFSKLKQRLIRMLAKQKYYSLTVDIWSNQKQTYIGISIHFIDPSAYELISFILAYRRLLLTHNPFNEICEEFKIKQENITNIVTHNLTYLDDEETEIKNNLYFEDNKIIKNTSHILNEILDIDLSDIFQNKTNINNKYLLIPFNTLKKLVSFWDLLSENPELLTNVKEILESNFVIIPKSHRGMVLFYSIKNLLEFESKLSLLFEYLNLVELKPPEIEFLKEYISIYELCQTAIDILQNENNCFLGVILPTFIILEYKLKNHQTFYCEPVKFLLLNNIRKKFPNLNLLLESSKKFIIASISHPKFKLSWIPAENVDYCKEIFINECKELFLQGQQSNTNEEDTTLVGDDEFFRVLSDMNQKQEETLSTNENILTLPFSQAHTYFTDKRKLLDMLESYDIVKKIFLKYNTTIPTPIKVRKIFCKNGKILLPNKLDLCDSTFEMMLFLRSNKTIN